MSPNAMKNAAMMRRSVSGPVFVWVTSAGVGFVSGVTCGVTTGAEAASEYDTHS